MDLKHELTTRGIARFVRLYFHLCPKEYFGCEVDQQLLRQGEHPIYPTWHRSVLAGAHHFRDRDLCVMVSQSSDGQLLADTLKHLGAVTPRGSSRRGGSDALDEMISVVSEGHVSTLALDGPTGPPYEAKAGIIKLASASGAPLLPVIWDADHAHEFNSWDRTIMPLPFSRIVCVMDREPIRVPAVLTRDEFEACRQRVEERLGILAYQARTYVKNGMHVGDPRDIKVPADYRDTLPRRKPKAKGKH